VGCTKSDKVYYGPFSSTLTQPSSRSPDGPLARFKKLGSFGLRDVGVDLPLVLSVVVIDDTDPLRYIADLKDDGDLPLGELEPEDACRVRPGVDWDRIGRIRDDKKEGPESG
jgi:hypothetical protein